jgi:hypothetical protein
MCQGLRRRIWPGSSRAGQVPEVSLRLLWGNAWRYIRNAGGVTETMSANLSLYQEHSMAGSQGIAVAR